ncbi:MAG: alpha/beta hydrolase [Anaerolineae bacterium]|nr:alpha/beta hydrolase [Anaerolineae bacterium]
MPAWNTATCKTNGINIHYTRTGGGLQPIILLHGLTANGACWSAVARVLEQDYDVIMPDARGHGKSDAPLYGYRYEEHAGDIAGLVQTLGLSAPVLIGHSMGGMSAAVAAAHYPQLFRALILADPSFLSPEVQREVRDSDVAEQQRRLLKMSLNEIMAETGAKHPERPPELIELLARARLQTRMSAFDVLTPPNPDYRQLARLIKIPTLLVMAENGVLSPAAAAELQKVKPDLQVKIIPKAGHGLHYDQPDLFAGAVKSFLRLMDAATGS